MVEKMNLVQLLMYSLMANFALALFIIVFFLVLVPKEARHFIGLKIRKGISFITMDQSGGLRLHRVNFDGETFKKGKDELFMPRQKLNPATDKEKELNDILKYRAFWIELGRPAFMGYTDACFAANPQLITTMEAAMNEAETEQTKEIIKGLKGAIERAGGKVSELRVMTLFTLQTVQEFVKGFSQQRRRDTYEKGKRSMMYMQRRVDLGRVLKFAIPIGAVIVFLFLLQSGFFQDFFRGFGK